MVKLLLASTGLASTGLAGAVFAAAGLVYLWWRWRRRGTCWHTRTVYVVDEVSVCFTEVYHLDLSRDAEDVLRTAVERSGGKLLLASPADIVSRMDVAADAAWVLQQLPRGASAWKSLGSKMGTARFFSFPEIATMTQERPCLRVRVQAAVRIRCDERYVLVRRNGTYVPIGGSLRHDAKDLLVKRFCQVQENDLWFDMPGNQLRCFEEWLAAHAQREVSPMRHLFEALVSETAALSISQFIRCVNMT